MMKMLSSWWKKRTRQDKQRSTRRLLVEQLESREFLTATPYVVPVAAGVTTQSILTVGDNVGTYRMVGIPDGLGAFDNGNGTFTLLMNHELGNTSGVTRAHGAAGAFVSEWVFDKSTLQQRDLCSRCTSELRDPQSNAPPARLLSRFCYTFRRCPHFSMPRRAWARGPDLHARRRGGATGFQLATVVTGPMPANLPRQVDQHQQLQTWGHAWETPAPVRSRKPKRSRRKPAQLGNTSNAVALPASAPRPTSPEVDQRAHLMNARFSDRQRAETPPSPHPR